MEARAKRDPSRHSTATGSHRQLLRLQYCIPTPLIRLPNTSEPKAEQQRPTAPSAFTPSAAAAAATVDVRSSCVGPVQSNALPNVGA